MWRQIGYYGMYFVGLILMFTVSLCTYKKYKLKKSTALIFTAIALVGGLAGTVVMGSIASAVAATVGVSGGSKIAIYGAVMFTPLILLAAALISKQPWREILDLMAPSGLIFTACAKLGCVFSGCCPGIPCSFGVFNPWHNQTMFPSQILEFITMLIIIAICFLYAFRSKKFTSGTLYPFAAIIYASTRFIWEYFRFYTLEAERHIMFGVMTFWQFCCLLTIAVSVIWLVVMKSEWYRLRTEKAEERKAEELAERAAAKEKMNKKSKEHSTKLQSKKTNNKSKKK